MISLTYDAVGDASRWGAVLHDVGALTGADAVIQLGVEASTAGVEQTEVISDRHVHGMELKSARLCAELAPRSPLGPPIMGAGAGAALAAYEMVERDAFERCDIYQQWVRPLGLGDAWFGLLAPAGPDAAVLSAVRVRRDAPPSYNEDLQGADLVMPHLSRVHRLNCRLARAGVVRTLASVLEGLRSAALILSADHRVLVANPRAEALLAAADGLKLEPGGRLQALTASGARALLRLTRDLTRGLGGAASVERPSGRPALSLTAAPLAPERHDDLRPFLRARARPNVMLVIGEPDEVCSEEHHLTLRRRLAALYNLTPAEALTADMIHHNNGLPNVAAQLGVSHSTVATHRRRVFVKMGVHTQAEMSRRLDSVSVLR